MADQAPEEFRQYDVRHLAGSRNSGFSDQPDQHLRKQQKGQAIWLKANI